MLPVLQIGPVALPLPGLVLLVSLWVGLTLAERAAPRWGISGAVIYNLVFYVLIAGVVGARLGYVLSYPEIFIANPAGILSFSPELLDPWSGALAGLLAGVIYGRRQKLDLLPTLDALTPMAAVFMIGWSLSNAASGAAYGSPTSLPWGIELWGLSRHPVQIYAAVAAVAVLIILWPSPSRFVDCHAGWYFFAFLAFSAFNRLFLEAFRGDSFMLPGGVRGMQVLAWIILAFCLWWLGKNAPESDRAGENHPTTF